MFLAPPHTPQIVLATATTNSITMKLKPHASDKEPISGYTVRYKPEYGDWETVQVPADESKYTLQELGCGLKYQMVVNAFNRFVVLLLSINLVLTSFKILLKFAHFF